MVNMKYFTNLKWGTQSPVAFRDSELGLIRLRAHGIFNVQIVQPVLFINSFVGTMGKIDAESVSSYLKMIIVSRLNDYLGNSLDSLFNLPGRFDQLSQELQEHLTKDFLHFGLRLSHLYITSITPPEDVQSAIDDKSRMGLIQDMDKFMQLKTAMAIEKAADSSGEAASGLGLGLGMLLPGMFASVNSGTKNGVEASLQTTCPECQSIIPQNARFCPMCGHQQLVLLQCEHCGKNLTPQAKFCSRCGQPAATKKSARICSACKQENLPGAIFCNYCGERLR